MNGCTGEVSDGNVTDVWRRTAWRDVSIEPGWKRSEVVDQVKVLVALGGLGIDGCSCVQLGVMKVKEVVSRVTYSGRIERAV